MVLAYSDQAALRATAVDSRRFRGDDSKWTMQVARCFTSI